MRGVLVSLAIGATVAGFSSFMRRSTLLCSRSSSLSESSRQRRKLSDVTTKRMSLKATSHWPPDAQVGSASIIISLQRIQSNLGALFASISAAASRRKFCNVDLRKLEKAITNNRHVVPLVAAISAGNRCCHRVFGLARDAAREGGQVRVFEVIIWRFLWHPDQMRADNCSGLLDHKK